MADAKILSDRNVLFGDGSTVLRLETTRSDHEVARDLRERLTAASAPVVALIEEASGHGFVVGVQLARDGFGRLGAYFTFTKQFGD